VEREQEGQRMGLGQGAVPLGELLNELGDAEGRLAGPGRVPPVGRLVLVGRENLPRVSLRDGRVVARLED